jgi:hypothetical protein
MEKQEIIMKKERDAKHSVVYKSKEDVAVVAIYVMRKHLGKPVPNSIKVTIEEVQ